MLPSARAVAAAAVVLLFLSSSAALASPVAVSRARARAAVRALPGLDSQIVARINAARTERGLPQLRLSSRLQAAASSHTLEMVRRGYFDHASANGQSMAARLRRFYCGPSAMLGEALIWYSPDVGADRAVADWLAEPAHRAILLETRYHEIGISSVHARAAGGTYGGSPVTVITADFGARMR